MHFEIDSGESCSHEQERKKERLKYSARALLSSRVLCLQTAKRPLPAQSVSFRQHHGRGRRVRHSRYLLQWSPQWPRSAPRLEQVSHFSPVSLRGSPCAKSLSSGGNQASQVPAISPAIRNFVHSFCRNRSLDQSQFASAPLRISLRSRSIALARSQHCASHH